jgi:uncharacterized protein YndB with AHSA1/START domain
MITTARITQSRDVFSMTCGVALSIHASAARIWNLLTDATGFPRWNSTVTEVEGQPHLHSTRIGRGAQPPNDVDRRLLSSVQGRAHFRTEAEADGWSEFVMEEHFSGLMLPFVKGAMPDFGPVFERYANDLKREAERL